MAGKSNIPTVKISTGKIDKVTGKTTGVTLQFVQLDRNEADLERLIAITEDYSISLKGILLNMSQIDELVEMARLKEEVKITIESKNPRLINAD